MRPFESKKAFYATQHYPYGLAKSGEYTYEQVTLLERHGWAYQTLCSGEREPVGEEEEAFVLACRGEKQAITQHEKVWLKFYEKTSSPQIAPQSTCSYKEKPNTYSDDEEW